ncbi:MAG: TonB-dependent receptor [Flavobacteriales bacterium]|nr:TonB-dependent receptor [Flavobacteriales bacterium]
MSIFPKHVLLLIAVLSISFHAVSQGPPNGLRINGKVIDAQAQAPVAYATIVAKTKAASELVTGTTTDDAGRFSMLSRNPEVYIIVSFLGYQNDTIRDFVIENGRVDLGEIAISPDQEMLDEVVVRGEVSRTTFELDKRVFNVGKDLSTSGASAMEVLNNVPSVNVNIEGEVSLRGSSGVQILIDGKPSVLSDDPANLLGSITADMIEKIEVITNPSAKYNAEGTSGILNIVLKKEEKEGLNGSVSVNTGIPDNHSIGISLNRRTQKFNLFTQMGIGYRSLPRFSDNINWDRTSGTQLLSEGESFRNETFYNITLGTDYHINDNNVVTLSGRYAFETEDNPATTEFRQVDTEGNLLNAWTRNEDTQADNPKWRFDLQYKKQFTDHKKHTLLVSALGNYFNKDQSSIFSNITTEGVSLSNEQLTATDFGRADYTFKLDYAHPVNDQIIFETGAQYEMNDVGNDYEVRDLVDGTYVIDPALTNDFEYDQKVLGVYVTGAYEGTKAGVKLGLRMEDTDLQTLLATTDEKNSQKFTNLFPSFHSSYKFTENLSFQIGYSRRIKRPRLWDLNPFFNITNNFNVRTGNPDLLPEYTDSYELTGIYIMKKTSLSSSLYYRYTTDVMERVSVFEDNVNTTTPLNIGTNATTGIEVTGKYSANRWLTLNGDFNLNRFERKGEFQDTDFDFTGQQWSGRLTSKFKVSRDLEFEITGNYRSKFQTVQGVQSSSPSVDLGLRQKFMDGKLVANVGVRDLFKTRIFESVIDEEDFYLYSWNQRGRFITFGLSYGFGKGEAMSYSGGRRR